MQIPKTRARPRIVQPDVSESREEMFLFYTYCRSLFVALLWQHAITPSAVATGCNQSIILVHKPYCRHYDAKIMQESTKRTKPYLHHRYQPCHSVTSLIIVCSVLRIAPMTQMDGPVERQSRSMPSIYNSPLYTISLPSS